MILVGVVVVGILFYLVKPSHIDPALVLYSRLELKLLKRTLEESPSSKSNRLGQRRWPPESPSFGQSSGPCLPALGPAL